MSTSFRAVIVCSITSMSVALGTPQLTFSAEISGSDSSTTLTEIIVTAQKRPELLQTVPVSLVSLSAERLEALAAQNFEDFASYVPGLSFIEDGGPGQHQLVIRGITSGDDGSATVGVLVNDIPFGGTGRNANGGRLALDLETFDLDRVEVLRGPQGTLYGTATMGGLIRYLPRDPETSGFSAQVEVGGRTVDGGTTGYDYKGMLNIPLVDGKAALRLVALHDKSPDYIDNLGLNRKDSFGYTTDGVRTSVLFTPVNALVIKLSALGQNINQSDNPIVDVDRTTHQPVYCELCRSTPSEDAFRQTFRLYSANIDWDVSFAKITSISGYSTINSHIQNDRSEYLAQLLPFGPLAYLSTNQYDSTKTTQEIRLTSPTSDTFEWLVGGFYDNEHTTNPQLITAFNPTGAPVPPINPLIAVQLPSSYRENAGFGDVTLHIAPKLDASAGLRYSTNSQHSDQQQSGALVGPPQSIVLSSSDSATTYSFDTRYQFTADKMVYARIASGYRPGGANPANPLATVPTAFGPDKLWNYEIGMKTEWLERSLRFNADVYWIDWSKIQITILAAGFGYIANAGDATSKGVEFETQYVGIKGLTLALNGAYNQAKLTSIPANSLTGAIPGERLPQTPKVMVSATADYEYPVAADAKATFGASYRYVGDRTEAFNATPGTFPFTMKAYSLFDLRAGASWSKYRASLVVKNVANKRAELQGFTDQAITPTSPAQVFINEPRSFGIILGAKF